MEENLRQGKFWSRVPKGWDMEERPKWHDGGRCPNARALRWRRIQHAAGGRHRPSGTGQFTRLSDAFPDGPLLPSSCEMEIKVFDI
jgi:hypothetical protein